MPSIGGTTTVGRRQRSQRLAGEVVAVGVAVKRRIDVVSRHRAANNREPGFALACSDIDC